MLKVHILVIIASLFISGKAQTNILFEGFESGIPSTWTIAYGENAPRDFELSKYDTAWISLAENDTSTTNMVAASSSYFTVANEASNFIITPKVQLDTTVNHLHFSGRSRDASYPERFLVYACKDSIVDSISNVIYTSFAVPNYWYDFEINLEEFGLRDTALFFAFELITDDGFEFYLDDVEIFSDAPLSTSSLGTAITLYPNPATHFLKIESKSPVATYAIHSLSGRQVLKGNEAQIQVGNLPEGVYIIAVILRDGSVIKQSFVKK